MAVDEAFIASLYRDLLGREGSPGEIAGHINNPGGQQGLTDFFLGSPEYGSRVAEGKAAQESASTPQWQDVGGTPVYDDQPQVIGRGAGAGPQATATTPAATGGQKRDQWSGAATINPGGNFGSLRGFDLTNFYDPNMQTLKYQVGRILADYPPTPEGLKQAMADPRMRSVAPNARQVDFDGIDFGDGRKVDVGQNFDPTRNTGSNWWWGVQGGAAPSSSGGTLGTVRNLSSAIGPGSAGGGGLAPPGDRGITQGPLQQVGQDPLSQAITAALGDLLNREGTTGFGADIQETLKGLLERGGELPSDRMAAKFESARELLDKGRRTMIGDLRGDLANRNLLSEPGISQGVESGGLGRITENLAPEFSRALRDIYTEESQADDARLMTSLQLATGLASDQAKTLLATVGEGSARQEMLADIALRTLAQNQAWSMFLAEYGLERDQTLEMIQNGRIDQLMPLLQNFLQLTTISRGGFV